MLRNPRQTMAVAFCAATLVFTGACAGKSTPGGAALGVTGATPTGALPTPGTGVLSGTLPSTATPTSTPIPTSTPTHTLAPPVKPATPVSLGTAANYAVLAASTITNTGRTVITGDLGLSPGTAVTGFPPGTVNGTVHIAGAAVQAKNDLTAAYNDIAGRTVTATVPVELGGTTETPGVYESPTGTFGITGTLTLDARGDPDAIFIFEAASTLITASASQVVLINGADASNVYWKVGSSATLGTFSTLKGNILALTSITLTTGVTINGRALARNTAVTLDSDVILRP